MLEIKNPDQRISNDNSKSRLYDPVARILVIGVGGAGNNAINRMVDDGVRGVEFIAVNTDKQDLAYCKAQTRIPIGEKLTGGRGCGAMPEVGEAAANESKEAIRAIFRETASQKKADMVFITCGMGGGTGTGAAPIIASLAKEEGILTVGVVTKPFRFEGKVRASRAQSGINKMYPNVDTLIVIPNDKLFQVVEAKDGFKESFMKADEILKQSIRGITDLINLPALINLDFADIATVMKGKGMAHIAVGEGSGEDKVINAIKKAIESPLLDTTIDGATDLIVCISGKVSLMDVDAAMREIEPKMNPDVNIIFGAREDEDKKDIVTITLIATGIKDSMGQFPYSARTNIYRNMYNNSMNMNQMNMEQQNMKMDNMNQMYYQELMKQNQQNYNQMRQQQGQQNFDNSQKQKEPSGFSAFFQAKKKNNQNNAGADENIENNNTNLNQGLKSLDSLNVDLSKIDFAKKSNDTNSLLPDFITDNDNNK